jgi:hypothetical protein
MPRKGNYTQALAILLRGPLPSQEIEERLGEFKIARRAKADEPRIGGGCPQGARAHPVSVSDFKG